MIASDTIKHHISNVDDILRKSVVLAPPTKRLMTCKETSTVEKLFVNPGSHLPSSRLLKVIGARSVV